MPLRPAAFLPLILTLILVSGCQDPGDQVAEVETSIECWKQTITLTSEDWSNHSVPMKYVRKVIDAAREAVDQQQSKLKKIKSSDAQLAPAREHLQQLSNQIDELAKTIAP